jgi:O-antigen/teichoic acid export membrane protein
MNSGGNLLVTIMVARSSSVQQFGIWNLAYAAFIIAIAFSRGAASSPELLNARREAAWRRNPSGCLAVSFAIGVVASLCVLVGAAVFPAFQPAGLVFAVFIPVACQQDTLRFLAFARGNPKRAALLDSIWTVAQVIGFAALVGWNVRGVVLPTLVWGAGAVLATAVGLWEYGYGSAGNVRAARAFLRDNLWAAKRLLADTLLVTIGIHGVTLALAVWSGVEAVGAFRAGQTLLGGMNLLVAGLAPTATVTAIHRIEAGFDPRTIFWRWVAVFTVAGVAYGGFVYYLPSSWGQAILGDSWDVASPLLLAFALQAAFRGPITGAQIMLGAQYELNRALVLRVWATMAMGAFSIGGAVLGGAEGAAWGFLAGTLVGNVLALWYSGSFAFSAPRVEARGGSK